MNAPKYYYVRFIFEVTIFITIINNQVCILPHIANTRTIGPS